MELKQNRNLGDKEMALGLEADSFQNLLLLITKQLFYPVYTYLFTCIERNASKSRHH